VGVELQKLAQLFATERRVPEDSVQRAALELAMQRDDYEQGALRMF
jgi:hypothetical protein